MDRREANTSINLIKGYIMVIFNESSPEIRSHSDRSMTIINPLHN